MKITKELIESINAKEKYELILRDTVIHIPAKKGSNE